MSAEPLFIQKISQKNNHVFTVEWNDGVISDYRLSDLQRECPCASCVDEATGKRLLGKNAINEDVRAQSVRNVGRYALKIQFLTGCSLGIYSFDFLRQLSNKAKILNE